MGNKLRAAQIVWRRTKINVRLPAQLLSESVAQSLIFYLHEDSVSGLIPKGKRPETSELGKEQILKEAAWVGVGEGVQ